jgi:hypothetical protein
MRIIFPEDCDHFRPAELGRDLRICRKHFTLLRARNRNVMFWVVGTGLAACFSARSCSRSPGRFWWLGCRKTAPTGIKPRAQRPSHPDRTIRQDFEPPLSIAVAEVASAQPAPINVDREDDHGDHGSAEAYRFRSYAGRCQRSSPLFAKLVA